MIKSGSTKDNAIGQVTSDQTVGFFWDLIVYELRESWSNQLLQDVVTLWFTIHGFSVSSKLLEKYKACSKKNIKGSKGLRKKLH